MNELKYRLRKVGGIGDEAADLIEQQAAEIERLREVWLEDGVRGSEERGDMLKERNALQAKLSAMEKQEPVAYVMEFNDGTTAIQRTAYWDCKSVTPLYTSPVVQQPLTDEQIANLHRDAYTTGKAFTTIEVYHYFARAIEAAHNIGGQQP